MKVSLIDSTLREGLQTPGEPIFSDSSAMNAYISAGIEHDIAERYELYMPGPHVDQLTWDALIHALGPRAQIYVGPTHTFDLTERPQLRGRYWPMLATTRFVLRASWPTPITY